MVELVCLCLVENQSGAVSDGVDAAQIAGGVEGWVGSLWQRDVGDLGLGHCRAVGVSEGFDRFEGTVGGC